MGARIRAARLAAGLTQAELAGEQYSKAYVSALENSLTQPSIKALAYLAARLGTTPATLVGDDDVVALRLDADLHLASGDWQAAADGYAALLAREPAALTRAELLRAQAEALCRLDRGADAIAPAGEALELFTAAGRLADAALARYWLSAAYYGSDDLDEARGLLRGLLDDRSGDPGVDPDLHVRALVAAANVDARRGDHASALALLQEAQRAAAGFDALRRASFAAALSASYRELGDFEGALRQGQRSVALYAEAAAERDAAAMDNNLALTYLVLGNLVAAETHAAAAAAALARFDDVRKLAHVLDTQAQIAIARGQPKNARELATTALTHAEASSNHKAAIDALTTRARAAQALGDVSAAATDFERAADIAAEHGLPSRRAEVLRAWAALAAESGDHRRAYELMRAAASQ